MHGITRRLLASSVHGRAPLSGDVDPPLVGLLLGGNPQSSVLKVLARGHKSGSRLALHLELLLDQLQQRIDVSRRDELVLLRKMEEVHVEDLDEEDRVHVGHLASIGNLEGTLQALERALAVTVRRLARRPPKHVRRAADGAALVGLLEQPSAVLCRLGADGLDVLLLKPAHVVERGRRERNGRVLLARVGDLLLVADERGGDKLVRVLRLAHQERRLRTLQVESQRERGRESRHLRNHVGDKREQLVRAHLHFLLLQDARVDAARQREAREDDRHERKRRATERAGGALPVRRVQDAAVAVRFVGREAVDEARDGPQLGGRVHVDRLGPRVLRVDLDVRVLGEQWADELQQLGRVGGARDDAFLLDDARDERRGDLLLLLVRQVRDERRPLVEGEHEQRLRQVGKRRHHELEQQAGALSVGGARCHRRRRRREHLVDVG
mmetsp:Transcript_11502/g.30515  ORF Transcript_11502/g.30515 Transcript_11502/m.30515 type:complete len:440 (+) Transcript_11502:107-1426(+)